MNVGQVAAIAVAYGFPQDFNIKCLKMKRIVSVHYVMHVTT